MPYPSVRAEPGKVTPLGLQCPEFLSHDQLVIMVVGTHAHTFKALSLLPFS